MRAKASSRPFRHVASCSNGKIVIAPPFSVLSRFRYLRPPDSTRARSPTVFTSQPLNLPQRHTVLSVLVLNLDGLIFGRAVDMACMASAAQVSQSGCEPPSSPGEPQPQWGCMQRSGGTSSQPERGPHLRDSMPFHTSGRSIFLCA